MKKSVRSIAAAAAALTMAFSCVPVSIYAAEKETVPAVQAEEETAAKYAFTEGKTIKTPYDGTPFFVDSDGTVYYSGVDSDKQQIIFTLGENGKVKNSYTFKSYMNDDGIKITSGASGIKQIGNYLYLIGAEYDESSWFLPQTKNNFIIKVDTELNEIAKYNFDKKFRSLDTNGEKVVYIKGGLTNQSIYVCDMDGKNKKLLYSTSINMDPVEQGANSVAIAGNYVGFQRRTGYQSSGQKTYCGIIDIETGEVTLHEERSVQQVFSSNGYLVWYGDDGYYPDPEGTFNNVSSDVFEGGALSSYNYFQSRYKYYNDSEIYVFDGENYSVVRTPNAKELGYSTIIDSEGNLITTSYDKKEDKMVYRIYRGGELLDELKVDYKYSGSIVANGGTMAFAFTGRIATAEDWIGWNDSTPMEEVEAMKAEQAERAEKLKEEYPVKSSAYTYKS